eukprot:PhF_6_TR25750/c0_g1_i2/m.36299
MITLITLIGNIVNKPYTAIVDPMDDYFTRCRKFIISIMILMTPTLAFVIYPFLYQGETTGYTLADYVEIVMTCVGNVLFCIVPWITIRLSIAKPTDTFMDVWLFFLRRTSICLDCVSENTQI